MNDVIVWPFAMFRQMAEVCNGLLNHGIYAANSAITIYYNEKLTSFFALFAQLLTQMQPMIFE